MYVCVSVYICIFVLLSGITDDIESTMFDGSRGWLAIHYFLSH